MEPSSFGVPCKVRIMTFHVECPLLSINPKLPVYQSRCIDSKFRIYFRADSFGAPVTLAGGKQALPLAVWRCLCVSAHEPFARRGVNLHIFGCLSSACTEPYSAMMPMSLRIISTMVSSAALWGFPTVL